MESFSKLKKWYTDLMILTGDEAKEFLKMFDIPIQYDFVVYIFSGDADDDRQIMAWGGFGNPGENDMLDWIY